MESSTPQTKWTASSAGDSIVIVTTDERFDKRVREAFRRETYELITVADFASHEDELINTALAIEFVDSEGFSATLRFLRGTERWADYPLIGVHSNELLRRRRSSRDVFGGSYSYQYDLIFVEDASAAEIIQFTKRVIEASRLPDDPNMYRI